MKRFYLVLAVLFVLFALMKRVDPQPKKTVPSVVTEDKSVENKITDPSPAGTPQGDRLAKITNIEILPAAPKLDSILSVRLHWEEPEPVSFRYRWYVNQKLVGDQPLFPLKDYHQGDLVSVDVTPYNSQQEGIPVQGPTVKIGNNPPTVTLLKMAPLEPKAGEPVQAQVEGMDKDGDMITYSYQWLINGKPLEQATGDTLDGSFVHSSDQIGVVVTPSDGFSQGAPKIAQPIVVINQPPEITSFPPSEAKEGTFSYQVEAKDPDGDPLTYRLLQGPAGMNLDAVSGLLIWKVASFSQEKAHVTLQAEDGKGGQSRQQFDIQVR